MSRSTTLPAAVATSSTSATRARVTRPAGLALIASLAAIVATPAPSFAQTLFESPAATAQVAGVEFPMVVDTFDVSRITVSPVAELGVSASYGTPLQRASDFTLYVFSSGETVEEQFENAIEQLTGWLEAQRDTITKFTLDERAPTEVVGTDGTTYAGYRAIGTYDREGSLRRTWLYVFEKDGQLLKHRATTPEDAVELMTPHIEAFVAGTLGELDANDAAVEPEGLLWEQEYGPMRIGELHLPVVADGFAVTRVERNTRDARALRMSYQSQSRTDPALNVIFEAQQDTSLMTAFARAYAPLRRGAEQRELEFEEDPFMICQWRIPGDGTVEGISGGLRYDSPAGDRYAQVTTASIAPWHATFSLSHPPGTSSERSYPPILSEILARVASEGAEGRVDEGPRLREAPGGPGG